MSNHAAHNSKVFYDGISHYIEGVVKVKLESILREVAAALVSYIENDAFEPFKYCGGGNGQYPVWESQLRDATGIGVYIDGRVSSYVPFSHGRFPQSDYEIGETNIIGTERLVAALNAGATQFSKGIWIVLFSAVPYAYKVNTVGSPAGRGINFFGELKSYLIEDVMSNLQPIQS